MSMVVRELPIDDDGSAGARLLLTSAGAVVLELGSPSDDVHNFEVVDHKAGFGLSSELRTGGAGVKRRYEWSLTVGGEPPLRIVAPVSRREGRPGGSLLPFVAWLAPSPFMAGNTWLRHGSERECRVIIAAVRSLRRLLSGYDDGWAAIDATSLAWAGAGVGSRALADRWVALGYTAHDVLPAVIMDGWDLGELEEWTRWVDVHAADVRTWRKLGVAPATVAAVLRARPQLASAEFLDALMPHVSDRVDELAVVASAHPTFDTVHPAPADAAHALLDAVLLLECLGAAEALAWLHQRRPVRDLPGMGPRARWAPTVLPLGVDDLAILVQAIGDQPG